MEYATRLGILQRDVKHILNVIIVVGKVTPLMFVLSYSMNSTSGKSNQWERNNFSSKVNHVDASETTPPTSFTLMVE